jgi:hypothetical protein
MSPAKMLTSTWLQQLAAQMQEARRAYTEAAANYASIKAKYGDMLDHPNGAAALLEAAQSEALASQKYAVAVKAWSAFLIRNRLSVLPETEL